MSTEMSVYLKTRNDEFVLLSYYSGSSPVFKILDMYTEYGKVTPVTNSNLTNIMMDFNDEIASVKEKIEEYNNLINIAKEIKSGNFNDVLETIQDYLSMIDSLKEDIWSLEKGKNYFECYGMIANMGNCDDDGYELDEDKVIYIAYETERPKIGYNC